jgi:hypothetical protein
MSLREPFVPRKKPVFLQQTVDSDTYNLQMVLKSFLEDTFISITLVERDKKWTHWELNPTPLAYCGKLFPNVLSERDNQLHHVPDGSHRT